MLNSAGRASIDQGQDLIAETLQDGSAMACFEKMLVHQNVHEKIAADLCSGELVLAGAKYVTQCLATSSGNIRSIVITYPYIF